MKIKGRRWMAAIFAAAFAVVPSSALAATPVGDVITEKKTPQQLEELRQDIAGQTATMEAFVSESNPHVNFTSDQQARIVTTTVSATSGTYLPALNTAWSAMMARGVTPSIMPLGEVMTLDGITPRLDTTPGVAGGITSLDARGAEDFAAWMYGTFMTADMDAQVGQNAYQLTEVEFEQLDLAMTGYTATAGAVSGLRTINANSNMIHRHMRDIRGDMRVAMNDCAPGFVSRIWASPFHNNINQRNKDNLLGYKYKMTGVTVGYDMMAGPVNVGAAFTYSKGDFDWNGPVADDNKIHNYGASLYAQYTTNLGIFAAVDGGFNYGRNKWNNHLGALNGPEGLAMNGWERGRNHTNSYWIGGTLGYDFKTCSDFSFTPTVGLYYQHAKSSGYDTRVDNDPLGEAFMVHGSYTQKSLLLPVEITAAYDRKISEDSKISLRATGGYTYNFMNKGTKGTSSIGGVSDTINMRGMKSSRHTWNVGTGVNYNYKNFDIGVDYRYEAGKKYHDHSVTANVGVRF